MDMQSHDSNDITVGEIFNVQAYRHLLTVLPVLSSIVTCKLNPRVYDSLLVLLDAVHLYRVYRWLDTLPLYVYYELLITCTCEELPYKAKVWRENFGELMAFTNVLPNQM